MLDSRQKERLVEIRSVPSPLPASPEAAGAPRRDDAALLQAAQAFEASFLAEMLKNSGMNEMPTSFGGGAGEDAFGSLLTSEYARLLSERGGLGLSEQIFEVLKARQDAR
jgi:peptidoglycan hydrolase FlgJ